MHESIYVLAEEGLVKEAQTHFAISASVIIGLITALFGYLGVKYKTHNDNLLPNWKEYTDRLISNYESRLDNLTANYSKLETEHHELTLKVYDMKKTLDKLNNELNILSIKYTVSIDFIKKANEKTGILNTIPIPPEIVEDL